jgi:hypothetical protein
MGGECPMMILLSIAIDIALKPQLKAWAKVQELSKVKK